MDLPITEKELDTIIFALTMAKSNSSVDHDDLRNKLILIQSLMKDGKPYKKILREQYGMVA